MAGLLFIVSPTETGAYAYLKYALARDSGEVIFDRRKADRRRSPQGAVARECRQSGDRRRRDITTQLETFGWALVHRSRDRRVVTMKPPDARCPTALR